MCLCAEDLPKRLKPGIHLSWAHSVQVIGSHQLNEIMNDLEDEERRRFSPVSSISQSRGTGSRIVLSLSDHGSLPLLEAMDDLSERQFRGSREWPFSHPRAFVCQG